MSDIENGGAWENEGGFVYSDDDPGDENDYEEGGTRVPAFPKNPNKGGGAAEELPVTSPELELVGA